MGVWVLPNANSLDVIARVRKELEAIQKDLPTGMEASIAFDSTKYINSAIVEVEHTLLETVLIVIVTATAWRRRVTAPVYRVGYLSVEKGGAADEDRRAGRATSAAPRRVARG